MIERCGNLALECIRWQFAGFELIPHGDIDADTTFTFSLQFVQQPVVLERTPAYLLGFLLERLDRTLVNTTAFVDQMAGSGRLTRIYVSNYDNVSMSHLLTHLGWLFRTKFSNKSAIECYSGEMPDRSAGAPRCCESRSAQLIFLSSTMIL